MKQRRTNHHLMRPSDAILPGAMLVASILGYGGPAAQLYAAWFAVALLSLFACRGLRAAFAMQPSIRDVRGSVKCALLLALFGGAAAAGLSGLLPGGYAPGTLSLIGAGFLLNIEHIFYEYMYAAGEKRSAALSRGLTALFLLAGIILETSRKIGSTLLFTFQEIRPETAEIAAGTPFMLIAAGISALTAAVVGLAMGGGLRGRWNGAVLRCAPRAALQTALYPAAAFLLFRLTDADSFALSFFAGLTVYELCKTPFRRSPLESRQFNRALLIVGIAAALLGAVSALCGNALEAAFTSSPVLYDVAMEIQTACAAIFIAAICGFALFGSIRKTNSYLNFNNTQL